MVNVYIEYGVNGTSGLVDFPKFIDIFVEECAQEDHSEDEAKDIKFDDSED